MSKLPTPQAISALVSYADARVMLRAVNSPGRVEIRAIRAWWLLRGHGSERELALRWLPSRWRLMVADSEHGPWLDRGRWINGKRIPVFTRRAGEARRAEFLRLHPDCAARLERTR